jgi:hypothetical protein
MHPNFDGTVALKLCKANIDLKKTDSGKTALHNAAIHRRFECLKLLIDKKVIKLNL